MNFIIRIKNIFKKNRFLHFLVTYSREKDFREQYNYYLIFSPLKKSRKTIRRELELIRNYWDYPPYHYYRYRLYEKKLSDDQLLDYIPPFYFYTIYLPNIYKDLDLTILEDKIVTHKFFIEKNIPTAKTVAFVQNQKIFDVNGVQLSTDRFLKLIRSLEAEKFFIKPTRGKGGNGIFIIVKKNDQLYLNDSRLTEQELFKRFKKCDYIIEEGIIQRPDISVLNPSSVNTLRIITQVNNGESKISVAVLRIGRNSMFVDNSAKGGISAEINIETGRLSKYAHTEHTMEVFDHHPDTGVVFNNYLINNWDIIKNQILEYSEKLKEINEIGWDIALGHDRIYVIEANPYYGLDHLQCCIGGMRNRLNVKK
jgi:hypothetical protein